MAGTKRGEQVKRQRRELIESLAHGKTPGAAVEPLRWDEGRQHLPEPVRDVWDALSGSGVALSEAQRFQAVEFCRAVHLARLAGRSIDEDGPLINGRDGNLVRNPAVLLWQSATNAMNATAKSLGFDVPAFAAAGAPDKPLSEWTLDELERFAT